MSSLNEAGDSRPPGPGRLESDGFDIEMEVPYHLRQPGCREMIEIRDGEFADATGRAGPIVFCIEAGRSDLWTRSSSGESYLR